MTLTSSCSSNTPYVLQTERLTLRPVSADLLPELHQIFIDPLIRRYLLDDEEVSVDWTVNAVEASQTSFENNRYGLWVLQLKNTHSPIGFCGYWRFDQLSYPLQLLYGVLPAYWGWGLATEAARAVISYGFEQIGFPEIVAAADIPNTASFEVMKRLGMSYWKREGLIDYYKLVR
jgi:[ribosomal protein S5]-alanine N-acetyltransferase